MFKVPAKVAVGTATVIVFAMQFVFLSVALPFLPPRGFVRAIIYVPAVKNEGIQSPQQKSNCMGVITVYIILD